MKKPATHDPKKATKTTKTTTARATPAAPPRHVRRSRPDDADAFFPDPSGGPARATDPIATELAEEYVQSVTSAEESAADRLDAEQADEEGGPFVVSPASREFADGPDPSNPSDAEAEPLPSPMRGAR